MNLKFKKEYPIHTPRTLSFCGGCGKQLDGYVSGSGTVLCKACTDKFDNLFKLDYNEEAVTEKPKVAELVKPTSILKDVKPMEVQNQTAEVNKPKVTLYDDVKLPPRRRGLITGRQAIYPFAEMAVGQLFFVPGKNSKSFGSAVSAAQKRTGRRFTVQTISEREAKDLFPSEAKEGQGGVVVKRLPDAQ